MSYINKHHLKCAAVGQLMVSILHTETAVIMIIITSSYYENRERGHECLISESSPSKPELCWLLKAQISSVPYVYCCDFFVIPIKKRTNPWSPQRIINCIFCIITSTGIALSRASVSTWQKLCLMFYLYLHVDHVIAKMSFEFTLCWGGTIMSQALTLKSFQLSFV